MAPSSTCLDNSTAKSIFCVLWRKGYWPRGCVSGAALYRDSFCGASSNHLCPCSPHAEGVAVRLQRPIPPFIACASHWQAVTSCSGVSPATSESTLSQPEMFGLQIRRLARWHEQRPRSATAALITIGMRPHSRASESVSTEKSGAHCFQNTPMDARSCRTSS